MARSKWSIRRAILAALALAFMAIGLLAMLVYTGTLQINRPSRETWPVRGVDVSHYQGAIDWETLAQQDIRFAYIKATEGSGTIDKAFQDNWKNAQKTALRIGAYHFFSQDSPGEAQAESFCSVVEPVPGMLPPVADVEPYGAHKSLSEGALAELSAFVSRLEAHFGMTPILYTTQEWYGAVHSALPRCDIWIRSVYGRPLKDIDWTFWQYSNRLRLPGYTGPERFIDMNTFNGSREAFDRYPFEQ